MAVFLIVAVLCFFMGHLLPGLAFALIWLATRDMRTI